MARYPNRWTAVVGLAWTGDPGPWCTEAGLTRWRAGAARTCDNDRRRHPEYPRADLANIRAVSQRQEFQEHRKELPDHTPHAPTAAFRLPSADGVRCRPALVHLTSTENCRCSRLRGTLRVRNQLKGMTHPGLLGQLRRAEPALDFAPKSRYLQTRRGQGPGGQAIRSPPPLWTILPPLPVYPAQLFPGNAEGVRPALYRPPAPTLRGLPTILYWGADGGRATSASQRLTPASSVFQGLAEPQRSRYAAPDPAVRTNCKCVGNNLREVTV